MPFSKMFFSVVCLCLFALSAGACATMAPEARGNTATANVRETVVERPIPPQHRYVSDTWGDFHDVGRLITAFNRSRFTKDGWNLREARDDEDFMKDRCPCDYLVLENANDRWLISIEKAGDHVSFRPWAREKKN